MDINGISDQLEMCKDIISAKILIYQTIRNFIPCCCKTGSRSITQALPKVNRSAKFTKVQLYHTIMTIIHIEKEAF